MTTVVLACGFGFTNDYWEPFIKKCPWKVRFLNEIIDFPQQQTWIGVGHSLGFFRLNQHIKSFKKLVSLQGFSNFLGYDTRLHAIREVYLKRMIAHFKKNPLIARSDFYEKCDYKGPFPAFPEGYSWDHDLQCLKNEFLLPDIPLFVIGGGKDNVVPMTLLEDNFSHYTHVTLKKIESASHVLGYTHVDEVLDLLRKFIGS